MKNYISQDAVQKNPPISEQSTPKAIFNSARINIYSSAHFEWSTHELRNRVGLPMLLLYIYINNNNKKYIYIFDSIMSFPSIKLFVFLSDFQMLFCNHCKVVILLVVNLRLIWFMAYYTLMRIFWKLNGKNWCEKYTRNAF